MALAASSATSLATEVDDCGLGYQELPPQTCLTDGSGDLLCRNWVSSAVPGPLGKMKKPWTDFGIDYTQTDVGPTHACAVTSNFDIWCWGMNDFGQFGTGVFSSTRQLSSRKSGPITEEGPASYSAATRIATLPIERRPLMTSSASRVRSSPSIGVISGCCLPAVNSANRAALC